MASRSASIQLWFWNLMKKSCLPSFRHLLLAKGMNHESFNLLRFLMNGVAMHAMYNTSSSSGYEVKVLFGLSGGLGQVVLPVRFCDLWCMVCFRHAPHNIIINYLRRKSSLRFAISALCRNLIVRKTKARTEEGRVYTSLICIVSMNNKK